jgi:hypothetical protein
MPLGNYGCDALYSSRQRRRGNSLNRLLRQTARTLVSRDDISIAGTQGAPA